MLDLAADRPVANAAREAGLQVQAAQRTIKRLMTRGILAGRTALIDLSRLGLTEFGFLAALNFGNKTQRARWLHWMEAEAAVSWIAEVGGSNNFMFNVIASSSHEAGKFTDRLTQAFPRLVQDKQICQRLGRWRFPRGFLPSSGKRQAQHALGESFTLGKDLDSTDRKILLTLSESKWESLRDVARHLGMPVPTLARRVSELERNKILVAWVLRWNLDAIGISQYRLLVSLCGDNLINQTKLKSFCCKIPGAKLMTSCFGAWDFELEVDAISAQEIRDFVQSLRDEFAEDLRTLEVLPIFKHLKFVSFPVGR